MRIRIAEQKAAWRKNYDVGYTGFIIRRHAFVSMGIQWFSRWDAIDNLPSPSHAFTIIGEDKTVEAFSDGVHEGTLKVYLDDPDVALLVRRPYRWTEAMGLKIAGAACKHIGDKYGFRLIGALAVANSYTGKFIDWISGQRFSSWLVRLADSKREMICSESVADSLQEQTQLKDRSILGRPAALIKPVDLFRDGLIYEPPDYAVELLPDDSPSDGGVRPSVS